MTRKKKVVEVRTKWTGGEIRYGADGSPTFYLMKRSKGARPHNAVGHDETTALAALNEYMKDPLGWLAGHHVEADAASEPVYLSKELVTAYETARSQPTDNRIPNSPKWLASKLANLRWWSDALKDSRGRARDLRQVGLKAHVLPALEGDPKKGVPPAKGARHKREAIKDFYAWLRQRGLVTAGQDPVATLAVGQGGVALAKGTKRVPLSSEVALVANHLLAQGSRYGHALVVSAATGWHDTEIDRFARGGHVIDGPKHQREPGVAAILHNPMHKRRKKGRFYQRVSATTAASARVLIEPNGEGERVGVSIKWYKDAVVQACAEVKVDKFHPAWMRHTRATKALEAKYDPEEVAKMRANLGHAEGSQMLEDVYAHGMVPPYIPSILDAQAKPVVSEVEALRKELAEMKAMLKRATGSRR